jgi:hypothetical protein
MFVQWHRWLQLDILSTIEFFWLETPAICIHLALGKEQMLVWQMGIILVSRVMVVFGSADGRVDSLENRSCSKGMGFTEVVRYV